MAYAEAPSGIPGVVVWTRAAGDAARPGRILPDGCLDLVWDGRRLLVAGPDSSARVSDPEPEHSYAALRFSHGTGPAYLGLRACEVRDRVPPLEQVWPAYQARRLGEQVARDPVPGLLAWLRERAGDVDVELFGPRVFAMASAGRPVAAIGEQLGLHPRTLHRRCLPTFGYGPKRLARILRLGRALEDARAGRPLAEVAVRAGYADQPHLAREVAALAGTTLTELLGRRPG